MIQSDTAFKTGASGVGILKFKVHFSYNIKNWKGFLIFLVK